MLRTWLLLGGFKTTKVLGRRRWWWEETEEKWSGEWLRLKRARVKTWCAQVKGVRSTVFWTVSIVSGLFIRDGAARFADAKTELRWCSMPRNGGGIYISVHNQNAIMFWLEAGTLSRPGNLPCS